MPIEDFINRPTLLALMHRTMTDTQGHKTNLRTVSGVSSGVLFDNEETELLRAVDAYREVNHVAFVRPSDVLWIMKRLGYCKKIIRT